MDEIGHFLSDSHTIYYSKHKKLKNSIALIVRKGIAGTVLGYNEIID